MSESNLTVKRGTSAGVTTDAAPPTKRKYMSPYRSVTPTTHSEMTRIAEKAPPLKQMTRDSMYERL